MIHTDTGSSMVVRLIVMAFASMTFGAATAKGADIVGKWESNQGPMTITQEANGSYSVSFALVKGKVTGSLKDGVFQGKWVRDEAPEHCTSEREGSLYWGGFKVTFYTPEIFQGYWYWCADELKDGMKVNNWTGARPK